MRNRHTGFLDSRPPGPHGRDSKVQDGEAADRQSGDRQGLDSIPLESREKDSTLLDRKVRLSEHAVRRSFALETVVHNLETGTYYGLTPTEERVLDVLVDAPTVNEAIRKLGHPVSAREVERDVMTLCRQLLLRKLLELT
jgi:hypothetical protein